MRIRVWMKHRTASGGPIRRRAEPVTFGVPLPMGGWKEAGGWRLVSSEGRATPAQAKVLDRWHDGTIRWVLVDSRVDIASSEPSEFFLEEGPPEPAAIPLSISEDSESIVVDTAAARFTLRVGGAFPFQAVERTGQAVPNASASGLRVTDPAGIVRPVLIDSVNVEERGPLRSVVLIKGTAPVGGRRKTLDFTARVHFFAGLSAVRLLVTLTNPNRALHKGGYWDLGDPGSIFVKDVSLTVATSQTDGAVRVSSELGAPWVSLPLPFELYQDSSGGEHWRSPNHINRERRVPTTFRGYRIRSGAQEQVGLRATPAAELKGSCGSIALAVPNFWQNFPKAVESDGSALTLRLFPGQFSDLHEIQGGEQRTHECFLSFGSGGVSDEPLDWCRARVVPCVDPEWVLSSGAVPFLAPLTPEHAAIADTAIEGPDRFELKREVIDEYGWRHFGEIYGDHESVRQQDPPLVSHYNNQYDPMAGFIQQFLRTADPRWWTMATELASHVIDSDVYHTHRDKSAYNHGLFWHTYHYGDADTATHRSYPLKGRGQIHGGGPSADHNYTTGLMLHYFLAGEEASRQTAIDLGQFVIDMDDGRLSVFRWLDSGDTGRAILSAPGYFGPGRGPANSLNALIDAHRLSGHARFLTKADQLVKRVVHPAQDIALLRLDVPELRWFYTMFLQALGKYLHYRVELQIVDNMYAYGRASLLHFAMWMAANEQPYLETPERLEFPTETWPAQDIRKSDVFHFAALHSSGDDRASLEAQGRFFYRYAIETLGRMPTRSLARPAVVLLTSGYLEGWRIRNAGQTEPAGPALQGEGLPVVFVPQRVRAQKRAKHLVAAVLAVAGLLALLTLLR